MTLRTSVRKPGASMAWKEATRWKLGRDGPHVSVICFGAWPISGGMGTVSEGQAIATVRAAMDLGMTFIDTAEGYGSSESLIGKSMRGRRHEHAVPAGGGVYTPMLSGERDRRYPALCPGQRAVDRPVPSRTQVSSRRRT